jgi:hypothetical protein
MRTVVLANEHDCVPSRVFALSYEMESGNTNSVLSAFERALDSDTCRPNPDLWRCFIRFCHSRRELRPKAKEVFYRAIRYCPWSKPLMMEAFTTLVKDMSSSDLRGLSDTMASKNLRIHIELDEYMEKRKARERKGSRRAEK